MWKKLLPSLLVGLGCGYFAIRDVHFGDLRTTLAQVQVGFLILAVLPMLITHCFRTWRWQVALSPMQRCSFHTLFGINAVGFMMINLLPLRLGEFVRPLLLSQRTQIPYSSALATAVVERVFDGIAVLIILIVGVVLAPLPIRTIPYLNWDVSVVMRIAAGTFIPALMGLLGLIFLKNRALTIFRALFRWLPPALLQKLTGILETFLGGLSALKGPKQALQILFHSIMVWLMITLFTYCTLLAFNLALPWFASFTILGIICLGIMVPGPPGFVGNYELFCKAGLGLFGIAASFALGFSLVSHAFNLIFVLVMGLIFLPLYPLRLRDLKTPQTAKKMAGA